MQVHIVHGPFVGKRQDNLVGGWVVQVKFRQCHEPPHHVVCFAGLFALMTHALPGNARLELWCSLCGLVELVVGDAEHIAEEICTHGEEISSINLNLGACIPSHHGLHFLGRLHHPLFAMSPVAVRHVGDALRHEGPSLAFVQSSEPSSVVHQPVQSLGILQCDAVHTGAVSVLYSQQISVDTPMARSSLLVR